VVLQREDRVIAERLGEIAKFQMVPVNGDIRPSRLGQDAERYTDFMAAASRTAEVSDGKEEGSGLHPFRRSHPVHQHDRRDRGQPVAAALAGAQDGC
jgi:hypothetical protein